MTNTYAYYQFHLVTTTQKPKPIDCKWGLWVVDRGCSATCGKESIKTMTRQKIRKSSNDGNDCIGKDTINIPCNVPECQTTSNPSKNFRSYDLLSGF